MFNPLLNKDTGLEIIGTPEKSVRVEISRLDEVYGLVRITSMLKDYATQKGEDFDKRPVDPRIFKPIDYLEKKFHRGLLEKFDEHALPVMPREVGENPNLQFLARTPLEAVMNAIEHGLWRHILTEDEVMGNYLRNFPEAQHDEEARQEVMREAKNFFARSTERDLQTIEYSTVIIEAHSSSHGVLWTVAQQYGGENFVEKVEPILRDYSSAPVDLTYKNDAGRTRGRGLTRFFDPNLKDQVSWQFLPPHGLEVIILKQYLGNHAHDVEIIEL